MKKEYYKITTEDGNWWICKEEDLKVDIANWASEGEIKVEEVAMTEKEFNDLPEFEY